MSEKRIAWEYCVVSEKYYEQDWDGYPNQCHVIYWSGELSWSRESGKPKPTEPADLTNLKGGRLEDVISELGRNGWEMCAAIVIPREHEGLNRYHNYWFKRQV